MAKHKYRIPKLTNIMCYTDDTGQIIGIPVEGAKTYTVLSGGSCVGDGGWSIVQDDVDKYTIIDGKGTEPNHKIIARYTGDSNFVEVNLTGQHKIDSPPINAVVPPYIKQVKNGGYYILEWFEKYEKWVVTGGQCPDEVTEFTEATTITIEQHVFIKDGAVKTNQNINGSISTDVTDDYSRLESATLQGIYDIYGYEDKSINLFSKEPTFTYDKATGDINYEGLILNPGVAGVALYNFIISECNGADRHVYTYAFKCFETNKAPWITIEKEEVEVHSGKELNNVKIGTAEDDEGDTLSVVSNVISGNNLLQNPEITVGNNGDILINATAKDKVVGTAVIEYIIDDAHNYKADEGKYEYHTIAVNVVNHAPTVNIPDNILRFNIKSGFTQTAVIGTIQDEDDDNEFTIGDVYMDDTNNVIDSMSLNVDGSTLTATITFSDKSAGTVLVFFTIHDEHKVYSDMEEQQYQSFYVISENSPPEVNITRPSIDIRGLEEQEFTVATISDKDGDSEFEVKVTRIDGPKCYESIKLDVAGSSLKLKIIPSLKVSGSVYVHFKVDDNRKHYTKGEPPEHYIRVTCSNNPPKFNQTVDHLVLRNGETVTKEIGRITDKDGDVIFNPVMIKKDDPDNVVTGQMFVEDDIVKITAKALEGTVGEEKFTFTFDDERGNYDQGKQEEYELKIRVI